MVTILARDATTGCHFAVARMLSSRKTVAARRTLFTLLIARFREHGMEDPLTAHGERRIYLPTGFETNFGIAFCQSLCTIFHPDTDMSVHWSTFVPLTCFGCDVHAKIIVLRKLYPRMHRGVQMGSGFPSM